jgi:SAM-dependent methyltransferase
MANLATLNITSKLYRCPLCGSEDFEPLARHDRHLLGLVTVGCRACGLVQTNPRPTPPSLDEFYVHHYRSFYQGVKEPDDAYIATHNKDVRLRYTTEFLTRELQLGPQSSLLDYGCGEGSLFVALRQAGFAGRLAGVEPNAEFGRFAAERGRAEVVAQPAQVEPVDAIVVNHVLEHIHDPVPLLRTLAGRLKPGGRLYIDVPDVEEYSTVGDLHIAHLYHLTERTLARLVQRAGFTVVRCEKHRPPHHPRSVRLVAEPAASAVEVHSDPNSERAAWSRVRDLERQAWKWVVMKKVAGLPFARSAYRWLRRQRPAAVAAGAPRP